MIEQLSLDDARAARDAALERVDNLPWRSFADKAIAALAAHGGELTSEDVWAELDRMGIPRPAEKRCMGPALMAAVQSGLLIPRGYRNGANPQAHARPIRVYATRAAA